MAWVFVSRASFGEGAGRFLPMPPWGRLRAACDTTRLDGARGEEVVRVFGASDRPLARCITERFQGTVAKGIWVLSPSPRLAACVLSGWE